ncbi:3',5'-cyclic-nucleotide phosphodiesterase pde1 [Aspergillus nanangensis]|uniref:3',5'-cyclic-nucleotide phosphodiesterase pde1 n=1 Tax=Aspergillus nanangensis TaxID=2582783 RepID=A0AAD4CDU9_ASPNN|nr:3',5'-cyclic-nucleotide phosphodiesterase pde1 [Aspergillus nanangensis]
MALKRRLRGRAESRSALSTATRTDEDFTNESSPEAELSSRSRGDLQVIVLGPSGGPIEDRLTAFMVRSTSTEWRPKSLLMVDAGTLLAGIMHVLETHGAGQEGPFAGLPLPSESPSHEEVASHIFRDLIGSVYITHPHLDHVAGLVVNSQFLNPSNGPKSVAGLPGVISALQTHVFNEVMWPNLTDEEDGAGFITFQRLAEGGNMRIGYADTRGYAPACEGLLARCFQVSHGRCKRVYHPETDTHRRASSVMLDPHVSRSLDVAGPTGSPWGTVESSAFFIRDQATGTEIIIFGDVEPDSISGQWYNDRVWKSAAPKFVSGQLRAIFIECSYTNAVEDDYLFGHLCPRYLMAEMKTLAARVIRETPEGKKAASKRKLSSQDSDESFDEKYKRRQVEWWKKVEQHDDPPQPRRPSQQQGPVSHQFQASFGPSGASLPGSPGVHLAPPVSRSDSRNPESRAEDALAPYEIASILGQQKRPLAGLHVYLIHIKDDMDGRPLGDRTLAEVQEMANEADLGCEFHVAKRGDSIWI